MLTAVIAVGGASEGCASDDKSPARAFAGASAAGGSAGAGSVNGGAPAAGSDDVVLGGVGGADVVGPSAGRTPAEAGTVGAAGVGASSAAGSGTGTECRPGEEPVGDTCIARQGDLGQIPLPGEGSTESGDPSAPVVEAFGPTVYQGDSPFVAELNWLVRSPEGEALTCTIDFEGDGTVEQTIEDCDQGSVSHTYAGVGRHTPVLAVVDASGRSIQRAELVYSNRLILADGVHAVQELPGLVSAALDADSVALEFDGDASPSSVQTGDLLFDGAAPAYVREVTAVEVQGATVVCSTEPRALFDAFAGGFLGVRHPNLVVTDPSSPVTVTRDGEQLKGLFDSFVVSNERHALTIAVGDTQQFGLGENASLTFAGVTLNTDVYVGYLELDIWRRQMSAYVDVETRLRAHAELSASLAGEKSWAFPVPSLGVAVDLGVLQLAMGLILETGVTFDGKATVVSDVQLGGGVAANMAVRDPAGADSSEERHLVEGRNLTQADNTTMSAEAVATVYARPKLTLTMGDPGDDCGTGVGAEVAAAVEAGVRVSPAANASAEGAELCADVTAYGEAFATLKTGLESACGEWSAPVSGLSLWSGCYGEAGGAGGAGGAAGEAGGSAGHPGGAGGSGTAGESAAAAGTGSVISAEDLEALCSRVCQGPMVQCEPTQLCQDCSFATWDRECLGELTAYLDCMDNTSSVVCADGTATSDECLAATTATTCCFDPECTP